jgi:hypothetical protein
MSAQRDFEHAPSNSNQAESEFKRLILYRLPSRIHLLTRRRKGSPAATSV